MLLRLRLCYISLALSLHLHPCHSHSDIYFTLSASIGQEHSRHHDLFIFPDLQLYVLLLFAVVVFPPLISLSHRPQSTF